MSQDSPQDPLASSNPYQAANVPADISGPRDFGDAVAIRREYLTHEGAIKLVGAIYVWTGVVSALLFVVYAALVLFALATGTTDFAAIVVLVFICILSGLAFFQIWLGFGLHRLNPLARIMGMVFAALGTLAIPIGTIFGIYVMYLLISAKGEYVFSPPYKDVIAATPHLKYRLSVITRIAIWLLAIVVCGIITLMVLSLTIRR